MQTPLFVRALVMVIAASSAPIGLTARDLPIVWYFVDLKSGEFMERKALGPYFPAVALALDDKTLYRTGNATDTPGRGQGPPNRIIAIDMTTGTQRTVSSVSGTNLSGFDLSPDGQTIAIASGKGLARVAVDGPTRSKP